MIRAAENEPVPPSGPPLPAVLTRGLSLGYDKNPACLDIDLRIDIGEVVALIGPNGSGKSTLIRGLLGLVPTLAGQVELFGEAARRLGARHRIGYVPQRHSVSGGIASSVQEVVASGRLLRPRTRTERRQDATAITQALADVDLLERRTASIAALSGGQQRRALIARALAGGPDLLIMDEPTAGVDASSQEHLTLALARLADRGLTMLIVTHETEALEPILTRVITLADGRIVSDRASTAVGGPR